MSFSGLSSSSIELLESRIAPAGIITLDSDKDGYVLTGDTSANDLLITKDGSLITFTPRNGTLILDKVSGTTNATSNPISLDILSNRLDINMGMGADILTLEDLSLIGDLRVDSGVPSNSTTVDADVVEISNLRVAGNLTLNARSGAWTVDGESFYAGGNANITSTAQGFDLNVTSIFVGDKLTVDASIAKSTDHFSLEAGSFVVFNDFVVTPSVAPEAAENAILLSANSLFNVGGSFRVSKSLSGNGAVTLDAGVVDIAGRLSVENQTGDKPLSFALAADTVRITDGVGIFSRSTALTSVNLDADLVRIDAPVTAKFSKGDGQFSIVSDDLLIDGNVSFAAKGTGTLRLEGSGDIFGKVSASLGSGSGEVTVRGRDAGQLFIDGLNVTTPAKLPATAGGAGITVEDTSVFGKVTLRLGSGNDTVNIHDSDVYGAALISTGNGTDVVNLHTAGTHDANFYRGANVKLGGGEDRLTLGIPEPAEGQTAPTLTFFRLAVFDGGTGIDGYVAEGRKVDFFKRPDSSVPVEFSPLVRNFEPPV